LFKKKKRKLADATTGTPKIKTAKVGGSNGEEKEKTVP